MSTCKISYNGSEISSVDATASVSITYNNATIATLNDGDTKTLGCHDKVMASDVVIGSKTLNCGGKLMQGNIVVELVGSAPSGETWYFNDTIEARFTTLTFNFTSNNETYARIFTIGLKRIETYYENTNSNRVFVYNNSTSTWVNEAYRTIVLDEPATGDVLAFLEANATKLS